MIEEKMYGKGAKKNERKIKWSCCKQNAPYVVKEINFLTLSCQNEDISCSLLCGLQHLPSHVYTFNVFVFVQ